MFFCTLIFQLIYTAIDLLILWASWSGLQQKAGGSFFFQFVLWSMVIVLTLSMYYSYRAYSLFKKEYYIQHGVNDNDNEGNYRLIGTGPNAGVRGMSQYDNPQGNGQGGSSRYLYSGPGNQRLT